jgi:hypothetical protein
MSKLQEQHHAIAQWAAANIVKADVVRFIEAAENELLGLHEGNFARYQVRPSAYEAWRLVWERQRKR